MSSTARASVQDLEIVPLLVGDVEEILVLYEIAKSVAPFGFMATRSKEEYLELFAHGAIGVGLRDAGRLISYAIAHRLDHNPYPDVPLLSGIDPAVQQVYHGHGWTVHPQYRNRGLGQQLFEIRFQRMAEMKVDHFFGLAAVDNLSSVGGVLRAGAIVVGFAADETAMNYIVYWGHLRERLRRDLPPIAVDPGDHKEQERLFMLRHAGCRLLRPSSGERQASAELRIEFLPT